MQQRNHESQDWRRIRSHGSKHGAGHEAAWLSWLRGEYPGFPLDILRHNHAQVHQRLAFMRDDRQDLATYGERSVSPGPICRHRPQNRRKEQLCRRGLQKRCWPASPRGFCFLGQPTSGCSRSGTPTPGSSTKPRRDAVLPEEAIKDPFVLEFLGLKDEYSESELERH